VDTAVVAVATGRGPARPRPVARLTAAA